MKMDIKDVLLSILMEIGAIDLPMYEEYRASLTEERLFAIVIKEVSKLKSKE